MPRSRKPYIKIHPDFLLGRSPAGMRFVSMELDEQAIYLKWLGRCIEVRRIFWETSDESLRELSQNIGISFRKFKRTFEKVLAKHLAVKTGENMVYLKGIQEIHAGYIFLDGDKTGTEAGRETDMETPPHGDTGKEVKRLRDKETTPLPPAVEKGDGNAGSDSGEVVVGFENLLNCKPQTTNCRAPGKTAEFSERNFSVFQKLFPAVAARGVTLSQVRGLIAGQNGATAQLLASLGSACGDEAVNMPLAVAKARAVKGAAKPADVSRAKAAMHLPRDKNTCSCGGELTSFVCQGSGQSGARCAKCKRPFSQDVLNALGGLK